MELIIGCDRCGRELPYGASLVTVIGGAIVDWCKTCRTSWNAKVLACPSYVEARILEAKIKLNLVVNVEDIVTDLLRVEQALFALSQEFGQELRPELKGVTT